MGDTVLTAPTGPIQIRLGEAGRLIVLLPYTSERVAKIKTVVGRRWHHKEKYWTVPHTDGAIVHLLALFAGELVEVEPSLRPVRAPDHREPLPEPAIPPVAEQDRKVKRLSQDRPATPRSGGLRRGFSSSRPPAASTPKLLDRVRLAIRARHYSYRTEKAYVGWIRRFIVFHTKHHPAEMGEAEIGQLLSSLASDSRVSASTQNQALNALLFLYREVLGKDIGYINGVVRAKRPRRLPVVLTHQEVRLILGQLQGLDWIMAMLLSGSTRTQPRTGVGTGFFLPRNSLWIGRQVPSGGTPFTSPSSRRR